MYVEVGNEHAIEGYRENDDEVLFRKVEGQRVTRLEYPSGIGLQEAFSATVTALTHHIAQGEKPSWIVTDSPGLETLLLEHYGLSTKQNRRPGSWGKTTKD